MKLKRKRIRVCVCVYAHLCLAVCLLCVCVCDLGCFAGPLHTCAIEIESRAASVFAAKCSQVFLHQSPTTSLRGGNSSTLAFPLCFILCIAFGFAKLTFVGSCIAAALRFVLCRPSSGASPSRTPLSATCAAAVCSWAWTSSRTAPRGSPPRTKCPPLSGASFLRSHFLQRFPQLAVGPR